MRKILYGAFLVLAVTACVRPAAPPPVPRPAPPPVPVAPPEPPPAANWADRPVSPGLWTYRQDARGGIAMYGQPGGNAVFMLRCDKAAGRLYASRPGVVAGRMTLRATTGARVYDALPTGGEAAYVAATIAPGDPQLDALAFSRGRILIGLDGAADLILPIWPEFARVIEDCRG